MKRTPFRRKPPRRRVRAGRPGVTVAMPRGWRQKCAAIFLRDFGNCRRCGHPCRETITLTEARHGVVRPLHAIDHILPRRLFESGAAASVESNLALLCPECHAEKTLVVEPALYAGDILAFDIYCKRLAQSGPVPGDTLRAAAFARLKELVYG